MPHTQLPPTRTENGVADFRQALTDNMGYMQGAGLQTASVIDRYMTLSYTVRERLVDRWRRTVDTYFQGRPKFVYYLSAEYLLGRQLKQNLLYTGTEEVARQALTELGYDMDALLDLDIEPGLGNGGLGRLAACFLDSMATLDIPSVAYGIRYEYGIFQQSFQGGWQHESPDEWLLYGNPWEFAQADDMVDVGFGGYTENCGDGNGGFCVVWHPEQHVRGEPYLTLVPGYQTGTVNMLRLWRARASHEFDFQLFDVGDYARAVEQKTVSENITKVLYPNDNTPQGRELRLKQQYFFVACSIHDIIRRFLLKDKDWRLFPERVVIQLNDTHPTVAIPELMRVLIDEYDLDWDAAWDITRRTFGYTCHTLMPEALEKWPISLFGRLLPRHLEIVQEIDRRFQAEVRRRFPNDPDRPRRMAIIETEGEPCVRMAYLAAVGSFSINGVAELQSKLLAEGVMRDFWQLWPEKFNNKTNGVTPRRFVRLANPRLSALVTDRLGDGWLKDLEQLRGLEGCVDDPDFRRAWREVKCANKTDLAQAIARRTGLTVDPDCMFDVMVKRLHEYKRQLLKALHIITLYNRLKANPAADMVPRVFVFGAKAAPGYAMAKLIIRLINGVADVVNNDPVVRDRLKVVFLPNFNVSLGEVIYPAADLSEQISLAGKEASGTGNMKFALNGAVTIGTLDGANIEIRERVGEDNFFLFGLTADEVFALQGNGYNPRAVYADNAELRQVIDMIASGVFSGGDRQMFDRIVASLLTHDPFMNLADYPSYVRAQDEVSAAYLDTERWTRMSILNTARSGYFSSDRTIRQYAQDIWQVKPVSVALP